MTQKVINMLVGSSDDGTLNGIRSYTNDAIVVSTQAEDYILKGRAFEIHRRFEIDSTTVKFLLDTSAVTSDFILTMPLVGVCSADQVYLDSYKITSYTDGTAIPSINPNTFSTNTAETVFYQGITSTDVAGDDLREYIFGTQAQGNVSGGGAGSGTHVKVFTPGDLVCLEVVSTSTLDFELNWLWYEVTLIT